MCVKLLHAHANMLNIYAYLGYNLLYFCILQYIYNVPLCSKVFKRRPPKRRRGAGGEKPSVTLELFAVYFVCFSMGKMYTNVG